MAPLFAHCQHDPAVHGADLNWRRRCDDSCLFRNGGNVRRGRNRCRLDMEGELPRCARPCGRKLSRYAARGRGFVIAVIVTGRSPRSRKEAGLTVGMAPQRTSRICQQCPECRCGPVFRAPERHCGVQRGRGLGSDLDGPAENRGHEPEEGRDDQHHQTGHGRAVVLDFLKGRAWKRARPDNEGDGADAHLEHRPLCRRRTSA